jgi:hypothetical protein
MRRVLTPAEDDRAAGSALSRLHAMGVSVEGVVRRPDALLRTVERLMSGDEIGG